MGALDGRVALVTGGGSGIGRATALAFAREGARVVVAGRGVESSQQTVTMIEDGGGHATFVQADVSRSDDVETLVSKTVEIYGRLDCACNNAGVEGDLGPLLADQSEENFDRVMNTNLKGVWLCMKYEIAQMRKKGGAIVNVASVDGVQATPGGSLYAAGKAGVISLTKTAAIEYATVPIRVNAVSAGFFRTPLLERVFGMVGSEEQYAAAVPMKRIGNPDELARVMVWLCSDAASYVTGHSLAVDGGLLA